MLVRPLIEHADGLRMSGGRWLLTWYDALLEAGDYVGDEAGVYGALEDY